MKRRQFIMKMNNRTNIQTIPQSSIMKFVAHGKYVLNLANSLGWRPGARYTNLRDIRGLDFAGVGFLDINWKSYNFSRHLEAVKISKPLMTVARDIEDINSLDIILNEAEELQRHTKFVVIVPKDERLCGRIEELIPEKYILGFSVPTKYGGTRIAPEYFTRPVHLLGGRPDVQRELARRMPVASVDCNRFTLDAKYGDYFNGIRFVRHPVGGYQQCLEDSIRNIDTLWSDYKSPNIFPGILSEVKNG